MVGRPSGAPVTHDPVCGMPVAEPAAIRVDYHGLPFVFCSEFCRREFVSRPHAYEAVPLESRDGIGWAARRVAYFSMEIALENDIPTYAGGLGVLAGDTLRSCADLGVPVVAVSLVHREGYFRQQIRDGWQQERSARWTPDRVLSDAGPRVAVRAAGRDVHLRAWQYDVIGSSGGRVPVLLIDSDLPENDAEARGITDHLYGGDRRYRLLQEVVLGIGGVRLLEALGCRSLQTLHLNEGHAAFAPLALLRASDDGWNFSATRHRTVFTTHTPVAAGHDRFDAGLVSEVVGDLVPRDVLDMLGGANPLNMTSLALNLSHYVNGVALRHREIASAMFPSYEIHQITNGVHARTWTSAPFTALFDRHIPGWRSDPFMLRNAVALPSQAVADAHAAAKQDLAGHVSALTGRRLRPDVLTIGFARRATGYKRADLVLSDMDRLRRIAKTRPLQFVFAGKAHPADQPGKESMHRVLEAARELGDDVPIVYLPEHDLDTGLRIVAGVDLWLNTPLRPFEASGTSGMKAALNGVPSLSVLDGWWREGCVEGVTGWAIGGADPAPPEEAARLDAADLYDKLEREIAPLYYGGTAAWIRIMRQCIALNASFFNTDRMVRQYLLHAYAAGDPAAASAR